MNQCPYSSECVFLKISAKIMWHESESEADNINPSLVLTAHHRDMQMDLDRLLVVNNKNTFSGNNE